MALCCPVASTSCAQAPQTLPSSMGPTGFEADARSMHVHHMPHSKHSYHPTPSLAPQECPAWLLR